MSALSLRKLGFEVGFNGSGMTETRSRFERCWPLFRDAGAFGLGTFILVWQTVFEASAQVILVVAAFACLGITGSGIAQRILRQKIENVVKD